MIRSFAAGEHRVATKIHVELLPLFKGLFFAPNPMPIKAALKLQGWEVGGLRLPMCELPSELLPLLEKILDKHGLASVRTVS
jgi:4-hydroxy-tetrahydrodipicolinate synthase